VAVTDHAPGHIAKRLSVLLRYEAQVRQESQLTTHIRTATIAVPPKSQVTFKEWISARVEEQRNALRHRDAAKIYRYG
jgi:hypothetical protein